MDCCHETQAVCPKCGSANCDCGKQDNDCGCNRKKHFCKTYQYETKVCYECEYVCRRKVHEPEMKRTKCTGGCGCEGEKEPCCCCCKCCK